MPGTVLDTTVKGNIFLIGAYICVGQIIKEQQIPDEIHLCSRASKMGEGAMTAIVGGG